jgi:hypothetical protein
MTFQTDGITSTAPALAESVVAGNARYLALLRKAIRRGPA